MKTIGKIVLGVIGVFAALFVLIQLVPYGRNHSNPPVSAEPQWDSPQTRATFMTTCGDCHSNETKWPWYSHVAPVSWLVYRDVMEGRDKLNVSTWGQGRDDADEAAEELLEGKMPLPIYLVTHPAARLSQAEKQTLARGLTATFGGDFGHLESEDED